MSFFEGRIFNFLNKLANLIVLNILWVVCSLPIITIGPATTAGYYTALKLVEDEGDSVIKMYFRSFKRNFKQAFVLGIIFTIIGGVLCFDIYLCTNKLQAENSFKLIMLALLIFILLIFVVEMLYLWSLLSKFDNTNKQTVINAFVLSVNNYKKTVIMLVQDIAIITVGVICVAFVPQIAVLFFIFGVSLIFYANSTILRPILQDLAEKTI